MPSASCLGQMTRVLLAARERRRCPNARLFLDSSGSAEPMGYGAQPTHSCPAGGGGETLRGQSGSFTEPCLPRPKSLRPHGKTSGSPLGLPRVPSSPPTAQGFPDGWAPRSRPRHSPGLRSVSPYDPPAPAHSQLRICGAHAGKSAVPGFPVPQPDPSPLPRSPRSPGPHSTALTSRRPTTTGLLARCPLGSGPAGYLQPRSPLSGAAHSCAQTSPGRKPGTAARVKTTAAKPRLAAQAPPASSGRGRPQPRPAPAPSLALRRGAGSPGARTSAGVRRPGRCAHFPVRRCGAAKSAHRRAGPASRCLAGVGPRGGGPAAL